MGFGIGEILLVLAVFLLFFGGNKLPQLGKSLGQAINSFKAGRRGDDEGPQEKLEHRDLNK